MASLLGRPAFDESLGIQSRSNQLTGWTPQRHPVFFSDWRLNFWVAMTARGPQRRKSMSAPMSAIGVSSGLVLLTLSFVVHDPNLPLTVHRSGPTTNLFVTLA